MLVGTGLDAGSWPGALATSSIVRRIARARAKSEPTRAVDRSQESVGTPLTAGGSRAHLSMTMFRILAAKGRPVAKCREQKVSRH